MTDYSASNQFISGVFVGEASNVRLGAERYLDECTSASGTRIGCLGNRCDASEIIISDMILPVKAISLSNQLDVRITASPVCR